jgi:hypothetical protein
MLMYKTCFSFSESSSPDDKLSETTLSDVDPKTTLEGERQKSGTGRFVLKKRMINFILTISS